MAHWVIKGISYAYDVTFGIAPIPPGDYNKNGVVDAADYVLWRKGDLAADSNGDTVVDQTDYDFWRANFGNPYSGCGSWAVRAPRFLSRLHLRFWPLDFWQRARGDGANCYERERFKRRCLDSTSHNVSQHWQVV